MKMSVPCCESYCADRGGRMNLYLHKNNWDADLGAAWSGQCSLCTNEVNSARSLSDALREWYIGYDLSDFPVVIIWDEVVL